MSNRKRLHRGDPARTAPIRNFSKLYGKAATTNGAGGAKTSALEKPRRTGGGPLAQGVELAYSVIEKYIAEGRRTAEGLSTQPYATRPANDNLQDIMERVLRFQSEILPLWIDTLATLIRVDPLQNGHPTARDASPHTNGKQSEAMAVAIEVASIRPVQVSVELRRNCDAHSLFALGLNSVQAGKPALTQVSLVPNGVEGRVKLRVQIPDKQPSGTYVGAIVNRNSGEALGTVSVRITD